MDLCNKNNYIPITEVGKLKKRILRFKSMKRVTASLNPFTKSSWGIWVRRVDVTQKICTINTQTIPDTLSCLSLKFEIMPKNLPKSFRPTGQSTGAWPHINH